MVPNMITPDTIINDLGGTFATAASLGIDPSTVSCWRKRGIPARHWLPISRLAAELKLKHITLQVLATLGENA